MLTLSSSGRNVAYTVREVTSSDTSSFQTNLYVLPAHGRDAPRLLTRGSTNVSDPAWHPDGNRLAFVRPVEGTPQIFILSMGGGEPYQLTNVPHGARAPQWGPNGDQLLYASPLPERLVRRRANRPPPSERPGRSPQDTVQHIPPDTLLVLRNRQTLDPVDTLRLRPNGQLRVPDDTSQTLRALEAPSIPDSLREFSLDELSALTSDSVHTIFEEAGIIPDTTTVPVSLDPAATPDGNLVQIRRWLDRRSAGSPQVFSRLEVRTKGNYAPTPTYQHYFVVDVPRDIENRTPSRPVSHPVTKGFRSYQDAIWLPGGSQIVVSAPPARQTHPDRIRDRNLYVVDLDPYRIRQVLDIEGYRLTEPTVTSDGTTLAFHADELSHTYSPSEIGLFELDGRSDPQFVSAGFLHNVESLQWSPDGWYLYATARTQAGRPLYRFAPFAQEDTTTRGRTSLRDDYSTSRDTFSLDSTMVRTAPYDRMLDSKQAVQAFDVTDSKVIYAAFRPRNPSEIYDNTVNFRNERQLTSHNTDWLENRHPARTRAVTAWNDNLNIHGRLTRPIPFDDTLRYPLVIFVRGGPSALESFDPVTSWFERQYLAGQGFGVAEVRPRGSVGYGESFRRRNFQDWGPGPGSDVIAVTDSIVERAWVDSTRQAIAGRGYGGYLTAWLLSQTPRFRAGVAQNGVYDLTTFFGDGEAGPVLSEQFGGFPWTPASRVAPSIPEIRRPKPLLSAGVLPNPDSARAPRTALVRNSPLRYSDQISTPLLLVHGGTNHKTGTAQAEMLYRHLKLSGTPTEYTRYPAVSHDLSVAPPAQRVDQLVRLYEFMARFVHSGGFPPSRD